MLRWFWPISSVPGGVLCHKVNMDPSAEYPVPGGVLCHKMDMALKYRDRTGRHVERKQLKTS